MGIISEWKGKSICFPSNSYFTRTISDTIHWPLNNVQYKILSYADSVGCMSCKLQLPSWKNFIEQLDSICQDKDNKVLAIGNPVLNPGVKELYLKIIQGKPLRDKDEKKQVQTTVSLDTTTLSLGKFPWQEEQQATFKLKNTGDELLVIHDVVTSCGCLEVDYSKEPVRPGKEAVLHLTYKADYAGYVSKTVQVYCNAAGSPIKFRVKGEAE